MVGSLAGIQGQSGCRRLGGSVSKEQVELAFEAGVKGNRTQLGAFQARGWYKLWVAQGEESSKRGPHKEAIGQVSAVPPHGGSPFLGPTEPCCPERALSLRNMC